MIFVLSEASVFMTNAKLNGIYSDSVFNMSQAQQGRVTDARRGGNVIGRRVGGGEHTCISLSVSFSRTVLLPLSLSVCLSLSLCPSVCLYVSLALALSLSLPLSLSVSLSLSLPSFSLLALVFLFSCCTTSVRPTYYILYYTLLLCDRAHLLLHCSVLREKSCLTIVSVGERATRVCWRHTNYGTFERGGITPHHLRVTECETMCVARRPAPHDQNQKAQRRELPSHRRP